METKYKGMKKAELIAELLRRDAEAAELARLKAEYEHKVSEAYWAQGRNERGAGRKPKITDGIIVEVKARRETGMSIRAIAKELGHSIGLIHKAANS